MIIDHIGIDIAKPSTGKLKRKKPRARMRTHVRKKAQNTSQIPPP
jgi:hypothetical protein